jgi:hypothetical protein
VEWTLSIIVPYITLKEWVCDQAKSKDLMGLIEWEILEDILYYDCIMPEILKIEFFKLYDHMGYNAAL